MSDTATPFLHTPLGQSSSVPLRYDPAQLCAVARRRAPGLAPYTLGVDVWQLWEVSWRDAAGLPHIGAAQLVVPFDSPHVCESKSLKLYLLSLNDERFESPDLVLRCIARDVGACCGAPVELSWMDPHKGLGVSVSSPASVAATTSVCLEDVIGAANIAVSGPDEAREGLLTDRHAPLVEGRVHTHLFRSLCPVTGQPDWASVYLRYRGRPIRPLGLLSYLLSFRHHGALHESCVESLFADIYAHCTPESLSVDARFLRRGGIDINPRRSNTWPEPLAGRLWRQ